MIRQLSPFLLFGFLTIAATPARADVAPPDSCTTVGATCNNAGPAYDQPGTCVAKTCNRATPDGSMAYACSLCVVGTGTGGGTGAGGATATGGAAASDAGNKSGSSSDDGCGCTLAGSRTGSRALAVAFALFALVIRRKRRG